MRRKPNKSGYWWVKKTPSYSPQLVRVDKYEDDKKWYIIFLDSMNDDDHKLSSHPKIQFIRYVPEPK